MDIASELVDYAGGLNFDGLPTEVIDSAKKVVLDTCGVMIAGSAAPGLETLIDIITDWGGKHESSILIYGDKVPLPHAVLANGTMARAHDFDEVHEKAMIHSAASIVPTCLAIAENDAVRINGKDFISALVSGMDIMARLGLSLERSPLVTGMFISSQIGVFGATVAAGKLLRLDRREMINALGIAYSQAAGTVQASVEGSVMVPIQIGLAARAGILSAILARRGIEGPQDVFQGKFGYFPVYHQNRYDPSIVLRNLGKHFEITNVSIKAFPCCLCSHAAISATLQLAKEERINPQEVDRIRVRVNQGCYNTVCYPLRSKRNPCSSQEGRFSLPYVVAVALVRGHVSLKDFTTEAIQDREVRSLANKITPIVDEAIEQRSGRIIGPAVVELTLKNGRTTSRRVDFMKGHPKNPMTMEDCEKKFRICLPFSARPLGKGKMSALIKAVRELDALNDVSRIKDCLR